MFSLHKCDYWLGRPCRPGKLVRICIETWQQKYILIVVYGPVYGDVAWPNISSGVGHWGPGKWPFSPFYVREKKPIAPFHGQENHFIKTWYGYRFPDYFLQNPACSSNKEWWRGKHYSQFSEVTCGKTIHCVLTVNSVLCSFVQCSAVQWSKNCISAVSNIPHQAQLRTQSNVKQGVQPNFNITQCSEAVLVWGIGTLTLYHSRNFILVSWEYSQYLWNIGFVAA